MDKLCGLQRCTDLNRLLLLGIKREQVRDLLLEALPVALQSRHFLCHEKNLFGEFLLELLHVDCVVLASRTRTLQTSILLCTLIAVASFIASTNLNRSPRISFVNSENSQ